jgi:DNA-binding cell septation regulator SpoVG
MWKITINDITVFQKESNRWINMPSRQYEEEGKKKYFPFIRFDDPEIAERFTKTVLTLFDEWLKTKKEKPAEVQMEVPF